MPNNKVAIKLYQRYSLGERQFFQAQLEKVDLESACLNHIDLRRAKLDLANLKKADLSFANLKKSSLVKADLCRANLTGANLTEANLTGANLTGANLTGANLTRANLTKANLSLVRFKNIGTITSIASNFSSANLMGAFFLGVDLVNVNLEGAFYNKDTRFPVGFDPINRGMLNECTVLKECTIKELIARFDRICKCSNKYLGNMLTAKYFVDSRPDFDWLNKFEIDKSGQITYEGSILDSVSSEKLHWFQEWMNSFTKTCSGMIKNFDLLI